MRPLDYLRILRRRWWMLVVGALIGSLLAFVTRPSETAVIKVTAPSIQYRATHLLQDDESAAQRRSFDRLALDVIAGPVPKAAMAKLGASPYGSILNADSSTDSSSTDKTANSTQRKAGKALDAGIPDIRHGQGKITVIGQSPTFWVSTVAAVPDPATGSLQISATGGREKSIEVANVFADELKKFLGQRSVERYDVQIANATRARDLLVTQSSGIDAQIFGNPDPIAVGTLQRRKSDLLVRIDQANASISTLVAEGAPPAELHTFQAASSDRVDQIFRAGGTALTGSQRQVVGGAIGLFLALALLIILELVGARIRDVAGTEGAARMPVIAEIPVVKMNRADRFVVATAADPASLTAEAYRSLRTSLLAMWQRHPKNTSISGESNGSRAGARGRPLRTLLVTSPGPAEGKSISVVNMAAAFAETGVTVIVIDADFRRPTQTRYFDRPRSPNLADIDLTCAPEDLEAILQDTDVPGVRLAASAPTKSDPGHAIAVAKAAIAAAEQLADIVIVDSPPILLANDAADLALGVDASILLARSGWTRRSGIVSSADLLRRLEATVIGVVIVGAEHGTRAGYYGYYGYYGYGYGYAHPGEVSLMKRLLPWKGPRKPSAPSAPPSRQNGGTSDARPEFGVTTPSRPPAAADPDDPWV